MIALALAAWLAAPAAAQECPMEGETAADCPWAAIGRDAAAAPDAAAALNILRSSAPSVALAFEKDAKDEDLLSLWGKSVNYDEHAKAIIVPPKILEAVGVKDGHAGLTHTYGYLFSTLKTPYGFKRARWVSGEIERGLGLPVGLFSPHPAKGTTLLSNVTGFAGRVAFRGDPEQLALAKKYGKFDVSAYKVRRLTEKVSFPGGPLLTIRTDLVSYSAGKGALLIYSWRDEKAKRAWLITAFPVAEGFADGLFAPKALGDGQPVAPRYNARIEPLDGLKATGLRAAE